MSEPFHTYGTGMVKIRECADPECGPTESNNFTSCPPIWRVPVGTIYLPHACDEWVIGSVTDARKLIADLEKIPGVKL